MNLTTIAKVKQHIGIPSANTSKDALLEQIVVGVSAFIESFTNRKFGEAEYTEVLDGSSADEIFLKEYPIRHVLSISINGEGVDLDAEEESGQVVITNETGSIYRQGRFGSGRKAVRIVYTAGFDAPGADDESGEVLPGSIESAAIRLSARVYERRTAEGVSSASPGSFSVQYKDAIDSDIVSILESNKKRRL